MGNSQGSLGYCKNTTSDEVVSGKDLSGVTVAITGSSAGIGADTARVFFERGATIFAFNRNVEKANNSHKKFIDECKKKEGVKKGGKIYTIRCDLASLKSVKQSVEIFMKDHPDVKIDYLFANAGIMMVPFAHTIDGFESQIGINHFGHFTWIMGMLPLMKEPGRIMITSSSAHRRGELDFKDLNYYKRSYGAVGAYGHSKISNLYIARELNRLLKKSKKNILAFAIHPGVIPTELGDERTLIYTLKTVFGAVGLTYLLMKSIPQGSATQVLCALSDKIGPNGGGRYYQDCDVSESNELGQDMKVAHQLFKVSLLDTNTRYPFECEGEDVNDLKGVKSSRPENWVKVIEKKLGIKVEVEEEEEEEEEMEGEEEEN